MAVLLTYSLLVPGVARAGQDTIERTGDVLEIVIPALAFGTTLGLRDKEGRNQFAESFLLNELVTNSLKVGINRTRPDGGQYSFPSGHTSTSFQGASFFQRRYGWKIGILPYLGAAFVGYSRVEASKHYPSDVFAGAAIGILSTYVFTVPYTQIHIMPAMDKDSYGVALSMDW